MFAHVQEDLNGRVDALLDGGDCAVGVESTVITLAEGTPRVLRPGGVTVSAAQYSGRGRGGRRSRSSAAGG